MRARHVLHAAVVALGASAIASWVALAQSYPMHPITFVVPFPPGTNTDLVARPLVDRLSLSFGQPAIIVD